MLVILIFQKSVFLTNEGKKFFSHLLTNFPYIQSEQSKQKKSNDLTKLLGVNNDMKCVQANLLICYLYSSLHINILHSNVKNQLDSIFSYIKSRFL